MTISTVHVIDPVDRFRRLCSALGADGQWPADRSWLRFAAQAAVLRPAEPHDTARAIRAMLDQLRELTPWSDALQTPFGSMVASSLVQIGDTAPGFLAELVSVHRMLHDAGLPHSNWYELKTILALRLLSDGSDTSPTTINRLKDIYASMHDHHWWHIGRDDLPGCALLTACPGDPSAIANIAEDIYQELTRCGIPHGSRLLAAANILPLAGMSGHDVAHRYLDLSLAITEAGLPYDDETFSAEAMLALLDRDPKEIAQRLGDLHHELKSVDGDTIPDIIVAADLCFIDLVRTDRHGWLRTEASDFTLVMDLIRKQRALAVIIADVPTDVMIPDGPMQTWMY